MNENQIKGALITSGSNQTRIAEMLKVSKTSVHRIISKKDKSRRIAQAIANQIGEPLYKVFPEYKKGA